MAATFMPAFEHVPVGIALAALDGHYLKVNPALCTLLGYSEQELLALRFQDVAVAEDVAEGEKLRRRAIAGKIPGYTREQRLRRKNGELRWCSVAVQLVRDTTGRPRHFIAVNNDISRRKDAESRFQATFEQAAVGIAHTTPDGRFLSVNQRMCDMVGYRRAELRALCTRDLTHPDDRDRQDALRRELLAGQSNHFMAQKRYLRKNGDLIWVNRTVTLASDAASGEPYLIQVFEDITERKRAEQRLERANRARRVLAECSHVLVHATDEAGMLDSMCRIVVDSGGYKMAWVGLATGDPLCPVQPAAHAGYGEDAPMTGPVGWGADGRYQGFMYDVITAGKPHIARNILGDAAHSRRRDRAMQHGFQSSIALPLKGEGLVLGAFAIYAREPEAFDADEIALLTALADDIAFGVAGLRTRSAREQAESRLREHERRYRETFEQAAVGITRVDVNGVLVDANQKFCDMLGYAKDELLGKAIREITHPDDYGKGSQYRRQLARGVMASAAGEKRFIRKNGTIMWARRTMSTAGDDTASSQYVISVVEDITERKELERRFELTFDSAAVGMALGGLDGRYQLVNQRFADMLGYSREELKGKAVLDLVLSDDHAEIARLRKKLLDGEVDSTTDERRYIRKDGGVMWAKRTLSLARDATGKPLYFIGVADDITASKEREERYRTMFENAAVGITRVDLEGVLVDVNQKFCDMLGYAKHELLGKAIKDITYPEDYAQGIQYRAQLAQGAAKSAGGEKRFVRKDGTIMWARRTISTACDDAGKPQYLISVVEDITERKQTESRVARLSRARRVMTECSQALVRATSEPNLFHEMCRILVESGGYRQAWVGLAVDDEDKSIKIGGSAGYEAGYLEALKRSWAGDGRHQGIMGRVIATGEPHVTQNILTDADLADRSARALDRNYQSSVSLPLKDQERIIGGISIYATESDSFDDEEIKLLKGLVDDIAFGIAVLRVRIAREQAEAKSREHERQFRETFNQAAVGIVHSSLDGKYLQVNRKFCEMLGYSESELLGRAAGDFTHPEDRDKGREYRQPLWDGTLDNFKEEKRYVRKDGSVLWTNRTVSLARDGSGKPLYFIRIIEDITDRKEVAERYRATFDNAPVGIMHTDVEADRILHANPKLCDLLGYTLDEMLSMTTDQILDPEYRGTDRLNYREQMLKGEMGSFSSERKFLRKDGAPIWVNRTVSLVRDAAGTPLYFIRIIEDISDRREAEERLKYLAHYDALTSLPNRVLFYDRLKQDLARARRNDWVVAVMFIDLDRFKNVNDTLGHGVGDQLLKQVSGRLMGCVRSGDTVGRLGGDEFAITLSNLASPRDASVVGQKIMASLAEPFQLETNEVFVTASIGITLYPGDSRDQETLIRNADTAMYRAKELGRNSCQFYTPEMNARALEKLSLESSLRRALERREFVLYFQPKVSLANGEITGVEALLRWRHPDLGLVSPADFMPMLEETGLVVPTGEWVIRAACAQIKAWQQAGIKPVPVAVNLSARQFQARGLATVISRILEDEEVRHELLELEITESSIANNPEEAAETLAFLNALGVRVAIDDFGTGHSSLSRLKRFPLDALKIDSSFVRDITTDADDAAITRAIITMAHALELAVIAEGVETDDQLNFLIANGCDQIQGYYFSTPLSSEDCTALIRSERRLELPGQNASVEPLAVLQSGRAVLSDG